MPPISSPPSGGAYLPLDPKLPTQRLTYLARQCQCDVVLKNKKFDLSCEMLGVAEVMVAEEAMYDAQKALGLSAPLSLVASTPTRVKAGVPKERWLAYVLFTSGSTGKPKGVMVEHGSLVSFVSHATTAGPYFGVEAEAQVCRLYVVAVTFDVSVGVVWRTLSTGAKLVVAKPDAWLDPSYLLKVIEEQSVNSLWGVPSPWALVMDAAGDALPECLQDLHLSGEVSQLGAQAGNCQWGVQAEVRVLGAGCGRMVVQAGRGAGSVQCGRMLRCARMPGIRPSNILDGVLHRVWWSRRDRVFIMNHCSCLCEQKMPLPSCQ